MTEAQEQFMREAAQLALENVHSAQGGPFGAVIVRDGEVIARGMNRVTSTSDPTAHAEVVAIREAAHRLGTFDLSGCEIYTSCEPCPMCLGAIYWARLNRVYYGCTQADADAIGFSDQFIYEELARPQDQRRLEMRQLGREVSLQAFEAWTVSQSKVPY
ncbi:nucleoside deaminase [Deinococcus peraridilitoris]|uniref:Cytosine/adenosine deaminase n=1 Tax=Deinococcus peraridilitoris (strain DSM 19664 / LMG 22246 / CIP 109416 / KR-200) TaxID=937777 RepID=L0A4B1_DEIPD|nr:nucleoside deaminase [Deinococcus peraridilitoris]AFZ68269.1 cytosine/adenosine deaminase [Deinococcus peraridilitoris DSM 19664]